MDEVRQLEKRYDTFEWLRPPKGVAAVEIAEEEPPDAVTRVGINWDVVVENLFERLPGRWYRIARFDDRKLAQNAATNFRRRAEKRSDWSGVEAVARDGVLYMKRAAS